MLLHSPVDGPRVERAALRQVIEDISVEALGSGLSLVQSLLDEGSGADGDVLAEAGYRHLADLAYLRLGLDDQAWASESGGGGLSTVSWGGFTSEQLAEVVSRTYVDSMDCPGLSGLRRVEDVIAGHQASGTFTPETWWLVYRGDEPAGCILINRTSGLSAEVVYLGVVPEHRRSGVARAMVRLASSRLSSEGLVQLTLAVDTRNAPARRLYAGLGFEETSRRVAYIRH
jgi:ribosomal protein S18 acetylase RimI-like enzyme